MSKELKDPDWRSLNHVLPEGWDKYCVMMAYAIQGDTELKILSRIQKTLRAIYDNEIATGSKPDKID